MFNLIRQAAITATLMLCAVFVKGQKFEIKSCPIDTIKGIIYFQCTGSTHSTITEGYYIAACGGYQIDNVYGYDKVPTFIPAYFIRNDEIINGKRQVNTYKKQQVSGYFTDEKFNRIPIDAIYGMVILK